MTAPTTPSEWIAEQLAADAPRMCAEIEKMGAPPELVIRGLVEALLKQAYAAGLDKALAGVLGDIEAAAGTH